MTLSETKVHLNHERANKAQKRTHGISIAVAMATALTLALAVPVSAQAVNWYTYKDTTTAKVRTWYSVSTGATYNRARTTAFNTAQATAYASVAGIGTSYAPAVVNMSWATYQRVTASCQWDGYLINDGSTGLLTCSLGF